MRTVSAQERLRRQRLGARIAMAIEHAELTQTEAAGMLTDRLEDQGSTISQSYLAQMIIGHRRMPDLIIDILADITNVPVTFLRTGEGWLPSERTPSWWVGDRVAAFLPGSGDWRHLRAHTHRAVALDTHSAKEAERLIAPTTGKGLTSGDRVVVLILGHDQG